MNMRNKKTRLSFIAVLIFVLAFAALSACDNPESAQQNHTTAPPQVQNGAAQTELEAEPEDRSGLDDLGEFDFGGHNFIIFNRVNDGWANSRLDREELTGDVYNDSVFNRNRNIEDRFNVQITMIEYTDQGRVRTLLQSGVNDYDLFTGRNAEAFTFAQEGLINSINDLPYIDLEKAYWDTFLNEQLTIANRKYFAVGAFNFSNLDMSYVLVFNKQLREDYGLENPFDLVKNGTWTFDAFSEMSRAATFDLDGSGIMTQNDAWGYVARSNDVLPNFWISGGVKAAEKDSDDIPQNMMGTERFLTVISRIFDITHGDGTYFNLDNMSMFLDNRVLFNDATPFQLQRLRAMETDFGILPYPKFDEQQERFYTRIGGCELFFTSRAASPEDLIMVSVILEAMASGAYQRCVPAYYDIMLKTKLARDVESEEIIDLIFAHRVFDFVDNLWVTEIRDGPLNTMFLSRNNTLVSLNERLENVFNLRRDRMVEAFLQLDY